jgi:hypothetical protein
MPRIRNVHSPLSHRLPDDYLARGHAGWSVLFVAALGALSPLVTALAPRRRARGHRSPLA